MGSSKQHKGVLQTCLHCLVVPFDSGLADCMLSGAMTPSLGGIFHSSCNDRADLRLRPG